MHANRSRVFYASKVLRIALSNILLTWKSICLKKGEDYVSGAIHQSYFDLLSDYAIERTCLQVAGSGYMLADISCFERIFFFFVSWCT